MSLFLNNFSYFQFLLRASSVTQMQENSALIYMSTGEYVMNILASFFMTVAVIATVLSGLSYLKGSKELLKD